MGMMIDALITVVKSVAMAGGWFGLILGLIKIYPKLKEMGAELGEENTFLAAA